MAISTYAQLKTSVASWLNRTDLTTAITDFISLGEEDIRNDVRVQAMETMTDGTLTGETLDHPDRFIDARRLFVGNKKYDYRPPEAYQDARVTNTASIKIFTSIGQSLYILGGASGDAYNLVYRAAFESLSADDDTNWLLTNAPQVYLFSACRHGAIYLKDDAEMSRFEGLYAAAVARINARESKAAVSGSALQMTSAVTE